MGDPSRREQRGETGQAQRLVQIGPESEPVREVAQDSETRGPTAQKGSEWRNLLPVLERKR